MVVIHPRLVIFFAAVCLVLLMLSLRYDPARSHARVVRSCTAGLLLLLGWNALHLPHLGINPLAALAAGGLGLPGLGLLAVLAMLN